MFLLALEGPDFCGKTTIGTALLFKLRQKGVKVERTELPSRLITGILTDILRNSKDRIDSRVFALVYAADHLHHYLTFMKNNSADVVIMERSALSFFVYQGLILGVDTEWLKELNRYNGTKPDLTVVLKVPEEELIKRKRMRIGSEDVFEKEEFVRKVARAFYNLPKWLIKEFNVVYVEQRGIEETAIEIMKMIEEKDITKK